MQELKQSVLNHKKSGGLYSNLPSIFESNPELSMKIMPTKDYLELANDTSTMNYWERTGIINDELKKGDFVLYDPTISFNNGVLYLKNINGKLIFAENSGQKIATTKGTSFAAPIAAAKYIKQKLEESSKN